MIPYRALLGMSCLLAACAVVTGCQGTDGVEVLQHECYSCHLPDYENASNPLHVGSYPTECANCHTTDAWRPAADGHPESEFPVQTGAHAVVRKPWQPAPRCRAIPG